MRLFLFIISLMGLCQIAIADEDTMVRSKQWIEETRRKAVDLYNVKKYVESEKEFFELIAADYKAPTATYAVDYLKKIAVESGSVKEAVNKYRELKNTGVVKEAIRLNPIENEFFNGLKKPGKIEEYLFSLFNIGGFLAAKTSLLSFVLDGLGFFEESAYYFKKADSVVLKAQRVAYNEERAYLLVRPLHYYVPGLFDQLGVPSYSASQLQIVPFRRQQLSMPGIKITNDLHRPGYHANLAFFMYSDSNILKLEKGENLPEGIREKKGGVKDYFADVGWQSNPEREFNYGFDYQYFNRAPIRGDLDPYVTKSHMPFIWSSLWNKNDDELRARYDVVFTKRTEAVADLYDRSHGPQLAWSHLWNERYHVDFSYALKLNTDQFDLMEGNTRRSGHQHTVAVQASYPGKSNRVQPFARYELDRNFTRGDNFSTIRHGLSTGTSYLIGRRAALRLSAALNYTMYPVHYAKRVDRLQTYKAALALPLYDDYAILMIKGSYDTQTSTVFEASYGRLDFGAGLSSCWNF